MNETTCPCCKNPIYDREALLCHFCGESLNRPSAGMLGKFRYGKMRVLWYVIGSLVLCAFALLMIF